MLLFAIQLSVFENVSCHLHLGFVVVMCLQSYARRSRCLYNVSEKEQKKNFIRENMKQLKFIQGKSPKEPKYTLKAVHPPRLTNPGSGSPLGKVKSSPSNKSGKVSLAVGKTSSTNARKKMTDVRIKKGDMAEFLKRKELLHSKEVKDDSEESDDDGKSSVCSGHLRDIGCQTIESNLAQKLAESTKLTMLYPKEDDDAKMKASGDSGRHHRGPKSPARPPRRAGDEAAIESERNHSRLNAILERKDHKDPYLPSGIYVMSSITFHYATLQL